MGSLLAVDIGIKTGLALYLQNGKLCWYRSQNFGTSTRMRRAVNNLLGNLPDLSWIILEGGGTLAEIWEREARRHNIPVRCISAERWRRLLLYPREQRSGFQAKRNADDLAKKIILWSDAPRAISLRHDAAEAILIGLWGILDVGWLKRLPRELQR
jgi:hypothetical protein